jgi:AbrB family looped-hinge helix DNA binding protein
MTYAATITSKRQLTIPVKLFKSLGLKEGEKVILSENGGGFEARSALALVERLSGSLKVSKKLAKVDVDEAIEIAKARYFNQKYGKRSK